LGRKLLPTKPAASQSIVPMQGEGWFDVETTRSLWETAFKGPHSIAQRKLWVDRPSAGIPFLYVRTGLILSAALSQLGKKDEATRIRAQVDSVARATQLDDVVARVAR
jgi:hypothetical protein